ncbi:MAG: energy-coupling factor ABC transporter permease [Desulfuromonadaceae bacterium]|nr:energy-coupling factor ABC transporter permease [Desulfuromonadaceae bacterium]MDD2854771.1 energy-coupling factor ABC transporter permease [Desulfuromonadaceae bacterium]
MHMADALLSPAIGGTMWAASAATIAFCSKKVRNELDNSKIPLMGVLGAFIFAAQMINFTIPVTGSSGHLGGGLILSILLGPYAAFLTIASVLVVQALFFADGGLLALGCNIFNLGFFPAFIAYPLIYKKIIGEKPTASKISVAAIIAAVAGLQLGAFAVVLETTLSGISSLPFSTFVAMMQPIHLAIGVVEGFVTASVVSFVYKARPEIMQSSAEEVTVERHPIRSLLITFMAVAFITGGIFSWFASEHPDGLEWSIEKVTGKGEIEGDSTGVHTMLGSLQEKLAFLPDYTFRKSVTATKEGGEPADIASSHSTAESKDVSDEDTDKLGTSLSGIIGGLLSLAFAGIIGFILKKRAQNS